MIQNTNVNAVLWIDLDFGRKMSALLRNNLYICRMNGVKQYFNLQWLFVKRHLTEFGVNPVLGIILALICFCGLTAWLFYKSQYAVYVYPAIALSFILQLSQESRNEFLKFTFPYNNYIKIRIIENITLALPFAIGLCIYKEFAIALSLIASASLIVFYQFRPLFAITIPTPFSKRPFEFTVGFRQSFWAIGLAYFIAFMGLEYQNFNLAIFSLLLIFLICLTYYSQTEHIFYTWVHSKKTNSFLWSKINTAIIYSTLLSLPVVVIICLFEPNYTIIIGVLIVGYLYLTTIIIAKYCHYPSSMPLPQSIILSVGFALPPLLLLITPYFYKLTKKSLNRILK